MDDFEMEIQIVDSEEVEKSIWMKLVERGYVPSDVEIQDLADIFMDIAFDFGLLDEVVEIEEEE